MPTTVTRHEVEKLVQEPGTVLIEVLPTHEYEDEHIAGAINVPLKRLGRGTTSLLDRAKPVIVY